MYTYMYVYVWHYTSTIRFYTRLNSYQAYIVLICIYICMCMYVITRLRYAFTLVVQFMMQISACMCMYIRVYMYVITRLQYTSSQIMMHMYV